MNKLDTIDATISQFYRQTTPAVAHRLVEAILYSIQAGGKRLRPVLFLEVLEGFGVTLLPAHYQVAASVEMIHTGSLIHDDLPAMDDDDYRRGRLTSHRQFDEATAILAGDGLFLDAFGLVAQASLPSPVRVAVMQLLSQAAGTFGMVGGQMLDMQGEGKQLALSDLYTIHAHKTGQLLAFPFKAAAIVAEQTEQVQERLWQAGLLIGQAFQIRDDILDVTAAFDQLGKTPQKDLAAQKVTYPSLLGLQASYQLLQEYLDQAREVFQDLAAEQGFQADLLLTRIESLRLNG